MHSEYSRGLVCFTHHQITKLQAQEVLCLFSNWIAKARQMGFYRLQAVYVDYVRRVRKQTKLLTLPQAYMPHYKGMVHLTTPFQCAAQPCLSTCEATVHWATSLIAYSNEYSEHLWTSCKALHVTLTSLTCFLTSRQDNNYCLHSHP
jgi:hypothetical protein